MGILFSRPITAQVESSALRGAELYERLVRSANHLLSLFFVPLLASPFRLSGSSIRPRFGQRFKAQQDQKQQAAEQGRGACPGPMAGTSFASASAATGRGYQHARLAELGANGAGLYGLRRVQSNASRSSRATSTHTTSGVVINAAAPYSLAGIKANRETIERRRARAELAAAGLDVNLRRRNSANTRSSTPTPSSPTGKGGGMPSAPSSPLSVGRSVRATSPGSVPIKRHSMPVRPTLTPALAPTPRLPARRPSRRSTARGPL